MNRIYGYIGVLAGLFVVGVFLFILLMRLPVLVNTIFFYRGTLLLLVTSFVLAVLIYWLRKNFLDNVLSVKDLVYIPTIFFSLMLVFFTHIPVTADRSLTVYMLGRMNKDQAAYTENILSELFSKEYLERNKNVKKRLEEQTATGTIEKNESGYQITQKGRILIGVYKILAEIFKIDKANLSP